MDKHNQTRESWDRIDPNIPNDMRDASRLSAVAYLLRKNGHDGQWNDLPAGGWFKAQEKPKR